MKDGTDGPIENLEFRQICAQFNLIDVPESIECLNKLTPKSSLLRIAKVLGLLFFPHSNKGK